jgi:hypothetical protein
MMKIVNIFSRSSRRFSGPSQGHGRSRDRGGHLEVQPTEGPPHPHRPLEEGRGGARSHVRKQASITMLAGQR